MFFAVAFTVQLQQRGEQFALALAQTANCAILRFEHRRDDALTQLPPLRGEDYLLIAAIRWNLPQFNTAALKERLYDQIHRLLG